MTSPHSEQVLSRACENEAENAKRMRMGMEPISQPLPIVQQSAAIATSAALTIGTAATNTSMALNDKVKVEYKPEQLASLLQQAAVSTSGTPSLTMTSINNTTHQPALAAAAVAAAAANGTVLPSSVAITPASITLPQGVGLSSICGQGTGAPLLMNGNGVTTTTTAAVGTPAAAAALYRQSLQQVAAGGAAAAAGAGTAFTPPAIAVAQPIQNGQLVTMMLVPRKPCYLSDYTSVCKQSSSLTISEKEEKPASYLTAEHAL